MANKVAHAFVALILFAMSSARADDILSLTFTKRSGLTLHVELNQKNCIARLSLRYMNREIGPPAEAYRGICGVSLEDLTLIEEGFSTIDDLRPTRLLTIPYFPRDAYESGKQYKELPRYEYVIRDTCTESRTKWEPEGKFGTYSKDMTWPCER
jgi:hypothetical protein